MHIQICTLVCHFNWLKGFNWQQRGEDGSVLWPRLKELSVCLSCKTSFRVCLPGMQRSERSLAANVTVALWLSVQWTCCFGGKAGGWYPTYLITDDVHHTSPERERGETAEREGRRMLGICKQGLTDVAADDLWGSAEDRCHMHATALKGIGVRGNTRVTVRPHLMNSFIWKCCLFLSDCSFFLAEVQPRTLDSSRCHITQHMFIPAHLSC